MDLNQIAYAVAVYALMVLAVTRICRFITVENGPFNFMQKIRRALSGHENLYTLISCAACISVWVSAPFAVIFTMEIGVSPFVGVLVWLACSMQATWFVFRNG